MTLKPTKPALLGIALMLLWGGSVYAAGPTPPAKYRAALYQREVRAVLEKNHWRVTIDKTRKLVAHHAMGPEGATFGVAYGLAAVAWLTIQFTPVSAKSTDSTVGIVAYVYGRQEYMPSGTLSKPIPYNNPETTKQIREMLTEAEKRLVTSHPEYASQ